ncbi:O-antigen ligase family protein [Vibrio sp. 404]|uniref:O-antigen ligase family protein n=1 Tax=Vibrio marinisediminis TaxID=2758441 RepID=A0A7W2FSP2_9VIBR|nr:O-antigen ligase family protein [Vibrio marinisediminis]MBA5763545.1 O-antigen ligase family protein [Vibrio marinisediminis]
MRQATPSFHLFIILSVSVLIAAGWLFSPNPRFIFMLSIVPLGALFVINQTFWMVSLFVMFSFFRIHEALPVLYNLRIPLLLSLGSLSALCWHLLISKQLKPYWHPALSWMSLFWLIVILGVLFASNRGIALEYVKSTYWKIMLMSLIIPWLVNTSINLKRLSLLIVWSGLIVAFVALNNSVNGIGLVEGSRVTIGREFGSMLGDPNDLSLVLMFPLAFSFSFMMTKSLGIVRILGLICTIAAFLAVIETQSRGGLLGCVAVLGMFGLKYIRSKTLLFLIGIVATIVLFAVAGVSDRQSGGAAEEGIDASAMGRLYAWEAAFKMALERPLTGVGIDNFYANYFYYTPHWDGLNHAVHSTWFGVLAETGFVGLAIFSCFIVCLLRTCRKSIQLLETSPTTFSPYMHAITYAVFAGLVGTIVSSTFLTQGFNWPIYILAALTIACHHVIQIDSQNKNHHQT